MVSGTLRWGLVAVIVVLTAFLFIPSGGVSEASATRALLIGVDYFVSMPSVYPASSENVQMISTLLQSGQNVPEKIIIPKPAVSSAEELRQWIMEAFGESQDSDVNLFYLSTHCIYGEDNGNKPMLLLSNGMVENGISPQTLADAFEGIRGTHVLILDACFSGAFIGKGQEELPPELPLNHPGMMVLTSCGAREESWIYQSGTPGGFYFTQSLIRCLDDDGQCPADTNQDGDVTWNELYATLLSGHAASTPQIYPERSDFVIYRRKPENSNKETVSPIRDIVFSDSVLDEENKYVSIEFTASKPATVAYQVVYYQGGQWQFNRSKIVYDQAEQTAGSSLGLVSPGRKLRRIGLSTREEDVSGYALVQIMTLNKGSWLVQSGKVLSILGQDMPEETDIRLSGTVNTEMGKEACIFIVHKTPCVISAAIVNEQDEIVTRLCHRKASRPMGISGSVLYWDGRQKDGKPAPAGQYRVRLQLYHGAETETCYSKEALIICD